MTEEQQKFIDYLKNMIKADNEIIKTIKEPSLSFLSKFRKTNIEQILIKYLEINQLKDPDYDYTTYWDNREKERNNDNSKAT